MKYKYLLCIFFIIITVILVITVSKTCGITKGSIIKSRILASKLNLQEIYHFINRYGQKHNKCYPEGNSSGEVFFSLLNEFNLTLKLFMNPLLDKGTPKIEKNKMLNCGYEFNLKLAGQKNVHSSIVLVFSQIDTANQVPGLILFTDGTIKEYNNEKSFMRAMALPLKQLSLTVQK